MTDKKFNLTEKEKRIDVPERNISYNVFLKKDVAEFIRLLKEDAYLDDDDIEWVNVERINNLSGTAFKSEVEK